MSAAFPKLKIGNAGMNLPTRAIFYSIPGLGKTGLGSCMPRPVFLMTRGETGLLTLMDNGLIAPTDFVRFECGAGDPDGRPDADTWSALMSALDYLLIEDTGYKSVVLDTLNGAERLCFEHVVNASFDGVWDKFSAYGKGPESALYEWNQFVAKLQKINAQRRMAVMLLAHCRIKTFKNPEGDDYDRYSPEMHEKTWGAVEKWADLVLFGNHYTHAKKKPGELKAKAAGGSDRIIYTQRTAAYDAKNRIGLPAEIPMGKSAQEAWANLAAHVRAAKKRTQGQTQTAPVESVPVPAPVETEPVAAG